MKALFSAIALAAAATVAGAQDISYGLHLSHDSDGLNQQRATVRGAIGSGAGLKVGALRYSAADGWSANGQLLAATYRQATTGTQIDANAGVASIGRHDHAVASIDWLRQLGGGGSVGVSAERDVVDSRLGLDAGLTFNSVAAVADHAFTDRFNVGLAGGWMWFTDDNRRPFLRTRWNVSLAERIGLNAYLKTRSLRNSMPYRPEYFSPERLDESSLGLSTRFVAGGRVVMHAAMDAGEQQTESGRESIWSLSLGVSSARNAPLRWSLIFQAANAASLFSGNGTYRYSSLGGQLSVPL